jgi:hypothetical protein
MSETWKDIEAFYSADERRRFSGETDYGVMWADGDGYGWPTYRVSWVETTGEFYAVRLADEFAGHVELLGKVEGRQNAERALKGWAEVQPMTLDWVRRRLA